MSISSVPPAQYPRIFVLSLLAANLFFQSNSLRAGEVPSAEKLLPESTLAVLTTPDYTHLREVYRKWPQSQMWNDPAMRPLREKFETKLSDEFLKPLERELGAPVGKFTDFLQGQLTLAVVNDGWQGKDSQGLALLLLVDTRDKNGELKSRLSELRQKWIDSGKSIQTEKIRDHEFYTLSMSSNDMPKTLRKFFPAPMDVQEVDENGDPKKATPQKSELVFGQVDSLFIAGNSKKVVEKIVIRMTGGGLPSLGELASYQANHQALFRDAPIYGWINAKAILDAMMRKPSDTREAEPADPFAPTRPERMFAASGVTAVKSVAFKVQDSNQGVLMQFFLGVPESSRSGLLKMLAPETKESSPPPFVPADAVKFRRWRIDGQKAWAALEKMLKDMNPQLFNTLNFLLDAANDSAKEKDKSFDVRKNLIANLGNDLITYEKAPRGAGADSGPSLVLLGASKPELMVAALKGILPFLTAQSGAPSEREFLGRKICSVPMPNIPLPMGDNSKPTGPRTLSYVASGGYVALSTDASILEEYLRSAEKQGKTLRETPGLIEAAQQVGGTGTGLFGFQNEAETMRFTFATLKREASSTNETSSVTGLLAGTLGLPIPQVSMKEWVDYSLLPSYDRLAKYFYMSVYAGSASVDGLSLKIFTPTPPELKR